MTHAEIMYLSIACHASLVGFSAGGFVVFVVMKIREYETKEIIVGMTTWIKSILGIKSPSKGE